MCRIKKLVIGLFFVSMIAFTSACALHRPVRLVKAGDIIRVTYTCRAGNNAIIATTDHKIAKDPQRLGIPIFLSSSLSGPVELTAGYPEECESCKKNKSQIKGFQKELDQQLAEIVMGWAYGRGKNIRLTAQAPENLSPDTRYVGLAKIRRRTKTKQISRKLFTRLSGKTPKSGMEFPYEEGFTARVVSIDGEQVTIRLAAEPGTEVKTPFGTGTIYDRGNLYEVDIDVKKGDLIRSGDILGRAVKIEDRMFYIDFGLPFGGEELVCDVKVEAGLGLNLNQGERLN